MRHEPSIAADATRPDQNLKSQKTLVELRRLVADVERKDSNHWRGAFPESQDTKTDQQSAPPNWSTAIPHIDAALPAGGMNAATVHEIRCKSYGDTAAASSYALALLRRLADLPHIKSNAPVLWCQTAHARQEFGTIQGPALRAFGFHSDQFVFVEAQKKEEGLWAIEEGAKNTNLLAVIAEVDPIPFATSRRLALAAAAGGTPVLLLHQRDDNRSSIAETRWKITSKPSAPPPFAPDAPGHPRWHVELTRCRSGQQGAWIMEWNCETHRFSLVQEFSSRLPEMAHATEQHAPIPRTIEPARMQQHASL